MTYDQLLTLDAVIKAGSFKAASERLHKSQPSISIAIKKLEEEFQMKLFSRDAYRPKLTREGEAFYEKSKLALFHMQSLNALGEELAMGVEPEVRVGMDAICPGNLVYCNLKNFFQSYPQTNLHLSVDVISGTKEKLINGDIQIGIMNVNILESDMELFDHYPLAISEMIPVISSSHSQGIVSNVEELKLIPQVIIESTGSDKSKSYGILEGGRKWTVNDILTKKEIIIAGLGWGGLPDHMIREQLDSGELLPINLGQIKSRKGMISVLRKKNSAFGPVAKELWEKFKSISTDP